MRTADGCIPFETFLTQAAREVRTMRGSPLSSFVRYEKLEKRTINLLRCSSPKSQSLEPPRYFQVRFCNWVQIRKMDAESCGTFHPDLKVLAMWIHIPEAQEICLGSEYTICPFILKRAIGAATNHKQYQVQECVRYTSGSFIQRGQCCFLSVKPPLVRLDRFVAFQSNGCGAPARAPSFFCDRVTRHRLDADCCSGADLTTRWLSSYAWASSG